MPCVTHVTTDGRVTMPIAKNILHQANVQIFAHFMRQFQECSDIVQQGVIDMLEILDDPTADDDALLDVSLT